MPKILDKVNNVISRLSSKPVVGGLYVSDSFIQYFLISKDLPRPVKMSMAIPPGIIEDGKIKNREELVKYLKKLKSFIDPEEDKDIIRVVTCLPSPIIYAQHITIPNVGPKQIEETARLNLKMNSPVDINKVYASWELIRETPDKYDILGVFSEKEIVDKYRSALMESGFYPVVFEFPSLALSWSVNKVVGPKDGMMIILNLSPDGIDILLLKKGFLYFNYFLSWESMKNDEGKITKELFEKVLTDEVRRVLSFSDNQFNEVPKEAILVAPGVEGLTKDIMENNFEINITTLEERLSSWYTVMGSAIRGGWERGVDNFISLGTEKLEKIFYRDRALSFIRLWRNIFAGAMIIMLILLIGTHLIITVQPQSFADNELLLNIEEQQSAYTEFRDRAETFNQLVSGVQSASQGSDFLYSFLNEFFIISENNNIAINSIEFSSLDESINIVGVAPSSRSAVDFRDSLEEDERFFDVSLPFSNMTEEEDGTHFRMSFTYQN